MASYYWVMYGCGCTEGINVPEFSICKVHKKPIVAINNSHKAMEPSEGWEQLENANPQSKSQDVRRLSTQKSKRK